MQTNWKTMKLGSVAQLITSGSRGWAGYYSDTGAKFIRMTNLGRGGIQLLLNDMKYVTLPTNHSEGSRTLLQSGDILISITAELGKIGFVPADLGESYINQHVALVRLDDQRVETKMIAYLLSTASSRNALNRRNDAGAKSGLNLSTLQSFPICIPDKDEQRRIVAVLTTWDDYLEIIERKIAAMTAIKKGLMQSLLTGKIRVGNHADSWQRFKLGDLGTTYAGLSSKTKEDFGFGKPYITYMNIYSNPRIDINSFGLVNITESEFQNSVKAGDILFTTSSETPEEVGVASVLSDDVGELYLNSFCFGFRLNDHKTLSPDFARHYFRAREFRKSMTRIAQGASRYNLSKKYFMDTHINIPSSIHEQNMIAKILDDMDNQIKNLVQKKNLVQIQKSYLVKNLTCGQIKTPTDLRISDERTLYA